MKFHMFRDIIFFIDELSSCSKARYAHLSYLDLVLTTDLGQFKLLNLYVGMSIDRLESVFWPNCH